jgi:hypothetical protein
MKKAVLLSQAKPLLIVIAMSLVFLPLQFGFQGACAIPDFSFKEIIAEIQNISPADNRSYIGDVPVNISVRYYARSYARNTGLIPYQEISCLYQLDNGEWKNASLIYASEQKALGDPVSRVYWNYLYCNYSAVLEGSSNGEHLLDIDLKPDLDHHIRISSNGTYVFDSLHSQDNQGSLPDNAKVTFYVFGDDKPMSTVQSASREHEPFLTIAAIPIVAVAVAGVLVHFKKRNGSRKL